MYRNRRNRKPPLLFLLLTAAFAGLLFFMVDNPVSSPSSVPNAGTTVATPVPDTASTTATESDQQLAAVDTTPSATVTPQSYGLPVVPDGSAIFIPSAGIYADVVQVYLSGTSWDVSRLGNNVGHLQGTPWVNQGGNIVLSGHVELSDGRTGIFRNLHELRVGDLVILIVDGNEWRYIIREINNTDPDDLTPLSQAGNDRLTLITCSEYDFLRDAYLQRTIIVAERVV